MAKKPGSIEDPVQKELNDIKRLLVLLLRREGASQAEVAAALDVAQSSVSRMFSAGTGPSLKSSKRSKH